MSLFLVSWFVFSYSFPLTINFGVQHTIASKAADVDRAINATGVYFPKVSRIQDGRLKPVKITSKMED